MTETCEELQSRRKGRVSTGAVLEHAHAAAPAGCVDTEGAGTESSPGTPDKGTGRAGAHPAAASPALHSRQLPPSPEPQPRQQMRGWECSGRRISLRCTHRIPSLLPGFDAVTGNCLKPSSIKRDD